MNQHLQITQPPFLWMSGFIAIIPLTQRVQTGYSRYPDQVHDPQINPFARDGKQKGELIFGCVINRILKRMPASKKAYGRTDVDQKKMEDVVEKSRATISAQNGGHPIVQALQPGQHQKCWADRHAQVQQWRRVFGKV